MPAVSCFATLPGSVARADICLTLEVHSRRSSPTRRTPEHRESLILAIPVRSKKSKRRFWQKTWTHRIIVSLDGSLCLCSSHPRLRSRSNQSCVVWVPASSDWSWAACVYLALCSKVARAEKEPILLASCRIVHGRAVTARWCLLLDRWRHGSTGRPAEETKEKTP